MTRTAAEIAKDITETREWLRGFGLINVYGKTLDELAELEAKRMEAERRLNALERERAAYVRGATPSEADPSSS